MVTPILSETYTTEAEASAKQTKKELQDEVPTPSACEGKFKGLLANATSLNKEKTMHVPAARQPKDGD